ncbi:unnamed protein product [Fusarium graminearum]|uniref:Chromosome 1, complete genome n=1 Tax=Gibberella zeae (strain ATCC MYA-4620 / CBS 123657 / FGSC 9075 / NRRL 31084 / PH-1) TaxID=229533 RepID=A0A0E0RVB4_GIBZE|nr:hypothetical protein FG05_35078 [Fusarium graminearum]CEF75189.1 unnamed protein product [Fusarium graminearum]CZS78470.1 unnamed protein product [Fusarium graminearum]
MGVKGARQGYNTARGSSRMMSSMHVLFDRIFGVSNVKLNSVAWLSLFGTWPRATQANGNLSDLCRPRESERLPEQGCGGLRPSKTRQD